MENIRTAQCARAKPTKSIPKPTPKKSSRRDCTTIWFNSLSIQTLTYTLIQFVELVHSFKCTTLNHEAGVKLRLAIGSEVGLLLVHHKY